MNEEIYVAKNFSLQIYAQQYKSATQRKHQQRTGSRAQKIFFSFSIIIFSLFIFSSCKKADITFGSQLLDNGHTQVIVTDTVSIETSTVYVDSFITNNKQIGLAGVYKDPYFGTVRAKSFVEVAPPVFEDTFQNSTFDSLEIVLLLNKTYYGDTTKPISLNVYQLTENLDYADNSYLYNNSDFSTDEDPIGSQNILLRPNQIDSIHIRLSDDIGKQWLSMLQQGNTYMKDPSTFRYFFKGFCIKALGEDGVVFGFSDSVSVRLHFSQKELYPTGKQVVFNISNSEYQFNNISIDRTGTAISGISSKNNEISTTATNNIGYMQYITGTMVKLRFPYIRDLLQINGFNSLAGAELRIRPVSNSFSNAFPLPSTLRLATTETTSDIVSNLTYIDPATSAQAVQEGSLQIDGLYGLQTYYSYNVTDYIKYLLTVTQNNKYGLLVAPLSSDLATTFNRLLVQDNKSESYRTELIIYYLSVQ